MYKWTFTKENSVSHQILKRVSQLSPPLSEVPVVHLQVAET